MHAIGLQGKVIVTVQKCDNGYIVSLLETPQQKQDRPRPTMRTLDDMIDGIIDFNTQMAAEVPGENWKGEEGDTERRQKLREAFKKMNPRLVAQIGAESFEPRVEHKVFAFKTDILKYLEENL